MLERQKLLLKFLRSCATAQTPLQIDNDLMQEAADEFEALISSKEGFRSKTDEYHFHLVRAEQHARQAHDMLYAGAGPQRSLWIRMMLGRAQSILMSLWTQELRRKS